MNPHTHTTPTIKWLAWAAHTNNGERSEHQSESIFLANSFSRLDTSTINTSNHLPSQYSGIRAHLTSGMKMNFVAKTNFIPSLCAGKGEWNKTEHERTREKKKQFTQIKISFVLSWINSSNTALVNLNAAFSTSPPPNRKSTEQSGQRKSVREKRKEEYAYKQKVMWFPLSGSIFIHFAQRNHKCNNFACLLHRMKMP